MKLSGVDFDVQALKPFGELWTPRRGPVAMDTLMARGEVEVVVEAAKKSGLLVLEQTTVNRHWQTVYPGPNQDIAHTDRGPYAQSAALQMLHTQGGRSVDTGYARHDDLFVSANRLLPSLRDTVRAASPWAFDRYRLEWLLEQYGRLDGYYSFDGLEGFMRMGGDIQNMKAQRIGMYWEQGQDLAHISRELPGLERTYQQLMSYFKDVASQARGYRHSWSQHPTSTVLSYQDQSQEFLSRENIVYHFRGPGEVDQNEKPLLRDLLFSNESRRWGTTYTPYSRYLAEQAGEDDI